MVDTRPDQNIGKPDPAQKLETLQPDPSLSQRPDKAAHPKNAPVDVATVYGNEQNFAKITAADQRKDLHLPKDASAEDFFKASGNQAYKAFPKYDRATQDKALENWGLKRSELSPDRIGPAIMNSWRKETGLPEGASAAEIERAYWKKSYKDLATGNYDIDFD